MDYYLGTICLFAFGFAPLDFMLCQGQLLQIASNQALFALIGTKYGGDGRSTFKLPNLMNANSSPTAGMCYYIATQGIWPAKP